MASETRKSHLHDFTTLCIASALHERLYYFYLGFMVKLDVKVCSVTEKIYIRLSYQRVSNLLEHVLSMRALSEPQLVLIFSQRSPSPEIYHSLSPSSSRDQ